MTEYIEKEAAATIPVLPKEHREYQTMNLDDAYENGWDDALKCIEKIPPADVRPVKRGKWIVKTDSEGKTYGVCSCCGYKQYAGHLKYCPECGGKMDGPNQ